MTSSSSPFRVTPWVGRLMIANAVVLLLRLTVFVDERFLAFLGFAPAGALERPWTFVSYMFVHAGLLHLAFNLLGLFIFGSAVEERMGSRAFILYYFYCGIGAALLALLASTVLVVHPFVGASAAILGVGLAFARYWPDAKIVLFPLPIAIEAKTLVTIAAIWNLAWAVLVPHSDVAHLAHLGGLVSGYLFFRLQGFSRDRRRSAPRRPPIERMVMVQSNSRESEPQTVTPVRSVQRADGDWEQAEIDRVLDKISASGLASLTAEERRFLDEVSHRKKQQLH
ncbi:MAG TPA: rhomboid family intramembrane serine protease [Gemmatimonadales bacterium]|nr:rhomboid family intramembrane serine protease [Gemmatimonadales bacterium]